MNTGSRPRGLAGGIAPAPMRRSRQRLRSRSCQVEQHSGAHQWHAATRRFSRLASRAFSRSSSQRHHAAGSVRAAEALPPRVEQHRAGYTLDQVRRRRGGGSLACAGGAPRKSTPATAPAATCACGRRFIRRRGRDLRRRLCGPPRQGPGDVFRVPVLLSPASGSPPPKRTARSWRLVIAWRSAPSRAAAPTGADQHGSPRSQARRSPEQRRAAGRPPSTSSSAAGAGERPRVPQRLDAAPLRHEQPLCAPTSLSSSPSAGSSDDRRRCLRAAPLTPAPRSCVRRAAAQRAAPAPASCRRSPAPRARGRTPRAGPHGGEREPADCSSP